MKVSEWRPLAKAHRERAQQLLSQRQHDPIENFLWTYYRTRPVHLLFWHPGVGVELEQGAEYSGRRGYRVSAEVASVDPDFVAKHQPMIRRIHHLLVETDNRPAQFGCFGMHEWAMVYRSEQVRHGIPLRFDTEQTAHIVEQVGVRCSHFDAFRFFTPAAKPLNILQPTRENQPELDQPGCIHANMDLLKWSLKLLPMIPSTLLLDAYANARSLRLLDMQASPYDLTGYGLEAVRVETDAGRQEYQGRQQELARESKRIRGELIDALTLIDAFESVDASETNAGAATIRK